MPIPTLSTDRLVLRPFSLADAPEVARLAGSKEVASTTQSIPYPYSTQQAQTWIANHEPLWESRKAIVLAITFNGQLTGAVGLRDIDTENSRAETGYWLGVEWWGKGFATEAARSMLAFGFETLQLNRIYAHYKVRNPASGRVLEKIGMRSEGLLRQAVRKWGVFEDVALMAMLREDWLQSKQTQGATH